MSRRHPVVVLLLLATSLLTVALAAQGSGNSGRDDRPGGPSVPGNPRVSIDFGPRGGPIRPPPNNTVPGFLFGDDKGDDKGGNAAPFRPGKPPKIGIRLRESAAVLDVAVNGSADPAKGLQLAFGKVVEIDASGKKVKGREVTSLKSLAASIEVGITLVGTVNVSYAKMTIDLGQLGSDFYAACPDMKVAGVNGSVVVTSFLCDENVTFPYGENNTLTAPAGSLKFNVESQDWPFCNATNKLRVSILAATNSSDKPRSKQEDDAQDAGSRADVRRRRGQILRFAVGKGLGAQVSLPAYATNGPSGNGTFNISVLPLDDTDKTGFQLEFPASSRVFYDPVVSTDTESAFVSAAGSPSPSSSSSPLPSRSPTPASPSSPKAKSAATSSAAANWVTLALGALLVFAM